MTADWQGILVNFREATGLLALGVFILYVWVVWDARCRARLSSGEGRKALIRRSRFALGIALTWFSAAGTHAWLATWRHLGQPTWMQNHQFVLAMIALAAAGALIHIHVATYDRFGHWPWVAAAGIVGMFAWIV